MGFLDKLFGVQPAPRTDPLRKPGAKLQSFMRPSLAMVDSRDLTIPIKRRRLAQFAYGALQRLAAAYELDETQSLAVLVVYLQGVSGIHPQEVSQLVGSCVQIEADAPGQEAARRGAVAMDRWLAGDAGTAVQELAATLAVEAA
jgi:hypothetical protein